MLDEVALGTEPSGEPGTISIRRRTADPVYSSLIAVFWERTGLGATLESVPIDGTGDVGWPSPWDVLLGMYGSGAGAGAGARECTDGEGDDRRARCRGRSSWVEAPTSKRLRLGTRATGTIELEPLDENPSELIPCTCSRITGRG